MQLELRFLQNTVENATMDTLSQQPLDVKLAYFKNLLQRHVLPLVEEELGVLAREQSTFIETFALISGELCFLLRAMAM